MDAKERWLEVVRRWQTNPVEPGSDDHWSPELERPRPGRLEEIQSEKVEAAFAYLYDCSAFYRQKFEAARLKPADVRSVEDLWKVPITTKPEWVDDIVAHPPWGSFSPLSQQDWVTRGFMFFASSGTTGTPRAFRHTRHDCELWAWMWARSLWAQGVRPGDVLINCFGYGPFTAFWGAHYAVNLIGCPVIPGGGVPTERRASFIQRYEPTILMCTPSYALFLAEAMAAGGGDPAASSIRLVVTAGEPGPCIPATKRRLEEAWGAKAVDIFGGTEVAMAPLGYQCLPDAERQEPPFSPHLMEDCYVAEAIDPETREVVAEGETGLSVVSNLYSEAQPILRYEMGDLYTIERSECPCGRSHRVAVGGLAARVDDMMNIRGIVVYPSAFESVIRALPEVGDEFEVVVTREGQLDEVLVRVEPGQDAVGKDVQSVVEQAIRTDIGIRVQCRVEPPGTLVRPEMKARRVHDRRPPPDAHDARRITGPWPRQA